MTDLKINWFEIPVANIERAAKFYGAVLDVTFMDMDGPSGTMKAFLNEEAPVGALVPADENVPSEVGQRIFFQSDDIEAALKRAEAEGGSMVVPKTSIGPFGYIGQFMDSEGNRVALHCS